MTTRGEFSTRGFTLIEVVVALVVLEIGLLGVFGTLMVASRTLARAESLERAASALEGVADSMSVLGVVDAGERPFGGGRVMWHSPEPAVADLSAIDAFGDTLLRVVAGMGP